MHFVLDQNFPELVHRFDWPPQIELSPLRRIDPELTRDHEDWEILLALAKRGDVDGFITNDAAMLDLPREMVALSRTRLILVVTSEAGHQPLRATGLLMLHLEEITRRAQQRPIFYKLPASRLGATPRLGQWINVLAERVGIPPPQLISREMEAISDRL